MLGGYARDVRPAVELSLTSRPRFKAAYDTASRTCFEII